jgi:hypothetical protein
MRVSHVFSNVKTNGSYSERIKWPRSTGRPKLRVKGSAEASAKIGILSASHSSSNQAFAKFFLWLLVKMVGAEGRN